MTTGRELVMTSSVTISPCVKVSGSDLPAVTVVAPPQQFMGFQGAVDRRAAYARPLRGGFRRQEMLFIGAGHDHWSGGHE